MPSIAHRVIEYTWAGALQPAKSSTAYTFLRDDLQKCADDVVVGDLDYVKFMDTLRRELKYDPRWTEVVCRRGNLDINIRDSVQWQAALRTWEMVDDLQPLLFVIRRLQNTPLGGKKPLTNSAVPAPCAGVTGPKQLSMRKKIKRICICDKAADVEMDCIACDNPVSGSYLCLLSHAADFCSVRHASAVTSI